MLYTSERLIEDGILERQFELNGAPGYLWTGPRRAGAVDDAPAPLLLLGHQGDLAQMYRRLLPRVVASARLGLSTASLELPGAGARPRIPELEAGRLALRTALREGEPVTSHVVDGLVLPLVERAVPEQSRLVDELLGSGEVRGPIGYSGGFQSIPVALAAQDERLAALNLFAGSWIPESIIETARGLSIPVHMLLQWDDAGNDRDACLRLFDAFDTQEKSLSANMGGHTGVPAHAGEEASRFLARHLL